MGNEGIVKKYRGELIIALISTILSIVLTTIISLLFKLTDPVLILVFALGILLVILVVFLLVNLKRLLDKKFTQMNLILNTQFGFTGYQNQYYKRLGHFIIEKGKIAHFFINDVLQKIVDEKYTNYSGINEFNMFIDSGTTITPIFQSLLNIDIQKEEGRDFNIYTNNLAGIAEIHKITSLKECNLIERDFNLIPGRPLNKYMATTGDATQKFLNSIWEDQKKGERKKSDKNIFNFCILTANWFIVRKGLKRIAICARGSGHMAFKKNLVKNCDLIYLLAPLGKLIPLESLKALNDLLPDKEDLYEYFEIPESKRDNTFLITSYRPTGSISPLANFSIKIRETKNQENYTLCKTNPEYDPEGTPAEIKNIEFPHKYIRGNYRKIF